jgi:hypothetical protein
MGTATVARQDEFFLSVRFVQIYWYGAARCSFWLRRRDGTRTDHAWRQPSGQKEAWC